MSEHNKTVSLEILNELKSKGELTDKEYKKSKKDIHKNFKKAKKQAKDEDEVKKFDVLFLEGDNFYECCLSLDHTEKGVLQWLNEAVNDEAMTDDEILDPKVLEMLEILEEKASDKKPMKGFISFAKKHYRFSNKKRPYLQTIGDAEKFLLMLNFGGKLENNSDNKRLAVHFLTELKKGYFAETLCNRANQAYINGLMDELFVLEMNDEISEKESEELNDKIRKNYNELDYKTRLLQGLITLSKFRRNSGLSHTNEKITLDELYFLNNFMAELDEVNTTPFNDGEMIFTKDEKGNVLKIFNEEIFHAILDNCEVVS